MGAVGPPYHQREHERYSATATRLSQRWLSLVVGVQNVLTAARPVVEDGRRCADRRLDRLRGERLIGR